MEIFDLLLQQKSRAFVMHIVEVSDSFHRGVGTMADAEGVVDIKFGHRGIFFGQFHVVFGFARFKTDILKQKNLTLLEVLRLLHRIGADHIFGQRHVVMQQCAEALGHGFEGELFVILPFGAPHVTGQNDGTFVVHAVADRL